MSAGQRADLRADAGVKHERMLALTHSELVTVPDAREDAALATLNADPDVQFAAPNVTFHTAATAFPPNDPLFLHGYQWDLEQTGDADIDIAAAWNEQDAPGEGVDVAVVDQMVHTQHPDLVGQISDIPSPPDPITHPGCAAPDPIVDHGTHVAGTIVAARNNGKGITGIAPGARVVSVPAFDNCGEGSLAEVLAAFEYAGQHEIPVVVASFASDPLNPPDSSADMAFAQIFDRYRETLFVVAAGNEGMDTSETPVYPCDTHTLEGGDEVPNLICVGMTDRDDAPDCQSNVGTSVDVYAPGRNLYSSVKNSRGILGWDVLSGTSMSAAVVAGVAALAHSAMPEKRGVLLRSQLLDYANLDHPPGVDNGRINAARAVGATVDPFDQGGEGGEWASCDLDHDGAPEPGDKCPGTAGPFEGCLDTDGDTVHDGNDNCTAVVNRVQDDMDGDGIGDACDPDVDGDAKAEAEDDCPRVRAYTANGCPPVIVEPPVDDNPDDGDVITPQPTATPSPTPIATPAPPPAALRFVVFSATVTPNKRCTPGPRCKKAAKVTVKLTKTAKVALKVERKVGRKWKRVTTRLITVTTAGKSLTVRGKSGRSLDKGSYRVTATSGTVKDVRTFRV